MKNEERSIGYRLLETGTLAGFRIVDTSTELTPDKENVCVRVELEFQAEEDDDPADIVEWASFGFIFVLAVLSFTDARPRGSSEVDFNTKDEFNVGDFLQCLSFGKSGLHFRADYIRGRCLKTDITIRPDGSATLTTWGRGQAALRWLDRLKGKKFMEVL